MALSRTHRPSYGKRRLSLESLEDRRMMAVTPGLANIGQLPTLAPLPAQVVVPALNSLPGAAKSIYLDFNGHFQSVWNRTDEDQRYEEVFSQPAYLSNAEIRKIWETVAEDFAPFNVNVTTVEPPSFTDNKALRVVIAGEVSASMVTGPQSYVPIMGETFILAPDTLSPTGNSGYASVGSFTNGEPNVVYVFVEILRRDFGPTSEGNPRTLPSLIANTASHEAGHSFGLPHHTVDGTPHGALDIGSSLTTPIMGNNGAADRTLWSQYVSGSTTWGSIGRLSQVLSIRPDEHPNAWFSTLATPQLNVGHWFQPNTATVKGVVGNFSDEDWFRFSTSGGNFKFDVKTVEFANLDAKLELYQLVNGAPKLLASVDPSTIAGKPFSGLGANLNRTLDAGSYFIAVKSHGGYGDLGNFTLTVSRNTGIDLGNVSFNSALDSGLTFTAASSTAPSPGAAISGTRTSAVDAIYTSWEAPATSSGGGASMKLAAKKADHVDAIAREKLGSGLGSMQILDLAFAA